ASAAHDASLIVRPRCDVAARASRSFLPFDTLRNRVRIHVVTASVRTVLVVILSLAAVSAASAQTIAGTVRDETGGALPGVTVELRVGGGTPRAAVTDSQGQYRFDRVAQGRYRATFTLINFAIARRDVDVPASGAVRVDAVLHLSLNADVTVTGKRTF